MGLRIVSLNAWGGRIHAPLRKFIRDIDADIYCFQELYEAPDGVPDELYYTGVNANGFASRPHLFKEIGDMLHGYQAYFCPASQGFLLDGVTSTEHPDIRYGIGTFVRRSLPVVEQRSKFVFGEYRPKGWGEPPLPRVAHAIRVHDYESGNDVVVVHMHGLHIKSGKGDTPARKEQAENLLHLAMSMYLRGDDRLIICGDFNVLPDSYTVSFLKDAGLTELVTERGYTDTRTSLYQKPNRVPWADYMFVSENCVVQSFDVPASPEVSDHRPLILEIE